MKVIVLFMVIGRTANFVVDTSLEFQTMKECRAAKAMVEQMELQPPFYPSYVQATCVRVYRQR